MFQDGISTDGAHARGGFREGLPRATIGPRTHPPPRLVPPQARQSAGDLVAALRLAGTAQRALVVFSGADMT